MLYEHLMASKYKNSMFNNNCRYCKSVTKHIKLSTRHGMLLNP